MTREQDKKQTQNRQAEREAKQSFGSYITAERAQQEANHDYGFRLTRGGSR
jgi:hypothetical protein